MSLAKIAQPLFWLSKPLGVLPLAFERDQFLISKLSQLYTLCGTLCFLLGGYQKLTSLFLKLTNKAFSGQEILTFASNIIVGIFAGMNIYYSVVCSRKLVTLLNDLGKLLKTVKNPETVQVATQVRVMVVLLQIAVFANYMAITIYDAFTKGMLNYLQFYFVI